MALQGAQPKPTWQEEQSREQLTATHTLSTALTQLLQEPSLGSQKAAKPKAWGPWYAAKQLQLFNTHPPWHIWRGLLASRASKGSGNRHKPCSAKQTFLTIIPPAPGKHFSFVGDRQDVRRSTGHLHHLVAQQSLHNLGLAGEEQQPSAETSQPARLLPSLPTGPPRLNTALAASQFSSNTNNREISLFFFVPNSLQRDKRLRACSTEDNANISGAEESSQHKSLEREEVQQGLGFAPLPMWGVPGAVNACSEQAGAWCRMRWLKGSPAEEL